MTSVSLKVTLLQTGPDHPRALTRTRMTRPNPTRRHCRSRHLRCQLWACQSCTKPAGNGVPVGAATTWTPPDYLVTTTLELAASMAGQTSQRAKVPLFGCTRRFAHQTAPTLLARGRHSPTADCRPGGGLVGFDPRRQPIQQTRHPPKCYALTQNPGIYPTSQDVPEGASYQKNNANDRRKTIIHNDPT
jgi:hypothetical protein